MPSPTQLKSQSKMLLCIDDNEDVLECEKAFLESFGYTVLTAPSGGKALELASIHSVDVVIADYFMPEMDGQEHAFIAKDRLASQLLPAIAQLQVC
jgi:two-component system, sensor histidine kinase and response regulator